MRYTPLSKGMKITCKGGTSTQQWHTKIDEANIKSGDIVIVFLGSNDWYRKPDPKPILTKLKGTSCVWVGPPDMPKLRGPAADHLKKEIETDGMCKFLDSRNLKLQLPDGVHTSEPGKWLFEALKLLTTKSK
jgi:lysophospholipase L1-like esterase